IKSKTTDVLSPDGVPSVQSPADVVTRQRSLRIGATDDADDVDQAEDSEEEERAGGTEIVMMAHGLPRADAKMCCGCTSLSTRLGPDLKAHGLRVAGACL
ncbi:hypothetical protein PR003_g31844, partial [Phytophthora rubi]